MNKTLEKEILLNYPDLAKAECRDAANRLVEFYCKAFEIYDSELEKSRNGKLVEKNDDTPAPFSQKP